MDRRSYIQGVISSLFGVCLVMGVVDAVENNSKRLIHSGIYRGYSGKTSHRNEEDGGRENVILYSKKDDGYIEAYDNKVDSRLDIISMAHLTDGDSLESLVSLDELEKAFETISSASSVDN